MHALISHEFPWLSGTFAVFHDFPGLETGLPKFHDFPGPMVTLERLFDAEEPNRTCIDKKKLKVMKQTNVLISGQIEILNPRGRMTFWGEHYLLNQRGQARSFLTHHHDCPAISRRDCHYTDAVKGIVLLRHAGMHQKNPFETQNRNIFLASGLSSPVLQVNKTTTSENRWTYVDSEHNRRWIGRRVLNGQPPFDLHRQTASENAHRLSREHRSDSCIRRPRFSLFRIFPFSDMHCKECINTDINQCLQGGRFRAISIASFTKRFLDFRSFNHVIPGGPSGLFQL